MVEQPRPDDLARLRAEIDAFRARAERRERHRHHPRRFLPIALATLFVALIPLATLAANPFNDLTGGVHDANIDAIYNAGITRGCDPDVSYCPTGLVTREEMASFLARTAGLGGNPPVVNARTAVDASTALTAATAQNALALGGQPASAYQLAGQPIANAANAGTVGGFAPSGLVRAAQGTSAGSVDIPYTNYNFYTLASVVLTAPGPGYVLVTGAASFGVYAGNSWTQPGFRLRDTTSGDASREQLTLIGNSGFGYPAYTSGATSTIFAVTASGPRTFVLEARHYTGGANIYGYNGEVSALFVPFGPSGATTGEQP
jgi:hypothetical protein